MKRGEEFEIRACHYLNQVYKTASTYFHHEGGMDSTKSDIAVIKHGCLRFYIEAKDTLAHSGQFVAFPDERSRTFLFSPNNRSMPNEMTDMILAYMNNDFDRFSHAGTAGEALDIDPYIFSSWIINHYQEKGVKYIISYQNGYVILPIRKFGEYFHIRGTYRAKKSGPSPLPKKSRSMVESIIQSSYPSAVFLEQGKKTFASIDGAISQDRFSFENNTYYLSSQSDDHYEIKKLSNTCNKNVIFSIHLKKLQDPRDLEEFQEDLK